MVCLKKLRTRGVQLYFWSQDHTIPAPEDAPYNPLLANIPCGPIQVNKFFRPLRLLHSTLIGPQKHVSFGSWWILAVGDFKLYVRDRVRGELVLTAAGFGATMGENQVCDYVRVGLSLRNGLGQILMLSSVPRSGEPLAFHTQVNCGEMYHHLSGLDFADEPEDTHWLNVEIIFGSDHYWDLTTRRMQRQADGRKAIHTRLGLVVSGFIAILHIHVGQTDLHHGFVTHALQHGAQLSETEHCMKPWSHFESRSLWKVCCRSIFLLCAVWHHCGKLQNQTFITSMSCAWRG